MNQGDSNNHENDVDLGAMINRVFLPIDSREWSLNIEISPEVARVMELLERGVRGEFAINPDINPIGEGDSAVPHTSDSD